MRNNDKETILLSNRQTINLMATLERQKEKLVQAGRFSKPKQSTETCSSGADVDDPALEDYSYVLIVTSSSKEANVPIGEITLAPT